MSDSGFSMGGSVTASLGGAGENTSQPAAPSAELIKDSDTANFARDVIEASKTTPVLVDFWAPWCGPCKQLTPVLEKCVTAAKGQIRLVKINVDENQALAGQLRIQSIPAVFAFANGQPVDGFMGALPESQINEFINKIKAAAGGGGPDIEEFINAAKAQLDEDNANEALAVLMQVLQLDAGNATALALIVKCQIALGDTDAAAATFATIEATDNPEVASAKAALDLAMNKVDDSELAGLEEALRADPDNLQTRFDLAVAQNSAGDSEAAVEQLLHIIKTDRMWNEEAARKQLLTFFEAWGPMDKRSISGRRKLSALLFS